MKSENLSLRPYLLRAVHEWITDRGDTPQIVVQADGEDVRVPADRAKDGRLVLNISYQATRNLEIGSETLNFEARFGGAARSVSVPMDAVLCIFSRETGQGVVLTDELGASLGQAGAGGPSKPRRPRGAPKLRVVK